MATNIEYQNEYQTDFYMHEPEAMWMKKIICGFSQGKHIYINNQLDTEK